MKANNSMGIVRTTRWALCAAVLLCLGVAHAAGQLALDGAVYQEIEVTSPEGDVSVKRVAAAKVVPGGEVIYEISYSNTGDEPVTRVAIDNPVPPQLTFVDAEGAPPTAVSVDAGKTYGDLAALVVTDANGEARPAQPADVTHLRWVLGEVLPGAEGKVAFKARVK